MIIQDVIPQEDLKLIIITTDGMGGEFDVSPYMNSEAFAPLRYPDEFKKVSNGGYFIEWECGADLSADTIKAHLQNQKKVAEQVAPAYRRNPHD